LTPANLQAEWARLLVESLVAAGVTDAVLSPGARSAPLALAAHACSRLRCHDLHDERVAAFFALGQARASGRPSLLLCTSGTAAAHYLPAIVEASMSHVPMLVLGADRPPEMHDAGAPQTIDQTRLFGEHARWFRDVGVPEASPAALRALRRVAAQAVLAATFPVAGPVHLNVPLRKPLEPPAFLAAEDRTLVAEVDGLIREGPPATHAPRPVPADAAVAEVLAACKAAQRGLIVCGAAAVGQVRAREAIEALCAATRFPLLAEATSQLRFVGPRRAGGDGGAPRCDGFDALLAEPEFLAGRAPDLVLQFGAAPLSRSLDAYLEAHAGCPRWVFATSGWHDPGDRATAFVWGDPSEIARALAAGVGRREPGGEWERAFVEGDARVWEAREFELAGDVLSEGYVARTLVAELPRGALLALGNSLPVRHADALCRWDAADVTVVAQRGANGIDGLISGAAGAASVWDGPTALLLGDVSFLHDVGGLAAARQATRPLVVVVLNNDGGRIFESLPIGARPDLAEALERHLVMPHGSDLSHAPALFGIPFARVRVKDELRGALATAFSRAGSTVIEAVVPRTSEHGPREDNAPMPVVMLHGFAGGPESFAEVIAQLPLGWKVWAPGLPGHLGEPPPSGGFEAAVDGIAARIEEEVSCPVHLVGYSMGARVALGLAARHPALVGRATLIGVQPGLPDPVARKARAEEDARWARLIVLDLARFVEAWEALPVLAVRAPVDGRRLEAQRATRLRHDPAALAKSLLDLGLAAMPDYTPALPRIEVSVDLVVGEQDTKFRRIAEQMMGRLPRARLHIVPDCGHNVALERPAALATLLGGPGDESHPARRPT